MSALYIAPTLGFTETGLTGTSIGGDIVQIVANWKGPSGSITIAHNALPAYMMPIDVYLYYPDSMLTWVKTKISGKPALIEQPVSGPAPNSGVVRIAIGNNELVLASPDLDQGTLTLLAGRLIDSGSVKEVKQ